MNIAVVGATGKAGSYIVTEAIKQGLDVSAIVRSPEKLAQDVPYLQRSAFELTKQDIAPFDVLVSAFGVKNGEQPQHIKLNQHYLSILEGSGKRLIIVGSGGHLYIDTSRNKKVYDKIWIVRKGAKILEESYHLLEQSRGFDWTYMAPPVTFSPKGKRTGKYQTGSDVVLRNHRGKSEISYADYALALIDEVLHPRHTDMMFTVASV